MTTTKPYVGDIVRDAGAYDSLPSSTTVSNRFGVDFVVGVGRRPGWNFPPYTITALPSTPGETMGTQTYTAAEADAPKLGDIVRNRTEFLGLPKSTKVVDSGAQVFLNSPYHASAAYSIQFPAMIIDIPKPEFVRGDTIRFSNQDHVAVRCADGSWFCCGTGAHAEGRYSATPHTDVTVARNLRSGGASFLNRGDGRDL